MDIFFATTYLILFGSAFVCTYCSFTLIIQQCSMIDWWLCVILILLATTNNYCSVPSRQQQGIFHNSIGYFFMAKAGKTGRKAEVFYKMDLCCIYERIYLKANFKYFVKVGNVIYVEQLMHAFRQRKVWCFQVCFGTSVVCAMLNNAF